MRRTFGRICGMAAFIIGIIPSMVVYGSSTGTAEHDVRELTEANAISYMETTDEVVNPGRGFYSAKAVHYKISGNTVDTYAPSLYHMRLDISQFSGSYNDAGEDIELSEDMLAALDGTLSNLEAKGSSAIIRFAYDPWYNGADTIHEPDMEMILRHQEQIGEVLSRHADCIVSVECGLFGKWGEMHSGDKCSQENYNLAISKWLEVLPESIPISVRTPGHYAGWAGVDRSKLSENVTKPGEAAYRVGVYNDGYLGSGNDLGTYANRAEELAWLSNQAKHTLFGGEIVANSNTSDVKNTAAYMETEAFTTHTSYLNIAWNNTVVDAMKNEAYSGSDPLYAGKSGFEYIRNHLGYRYVVRDVRLTQETTALENFGIEVDIENVGFANLVKEKELVLILVGEDQTYTFPVSQLGTGVTGGDGSQEGVSDSTSGLNESAENADPRAWDSRGTTTFRAVCDLPDDMTLGDYRVYLRIASDSENTGSGGYPVRFANADKELSESGLSNGSEGGSTENNASGTDSVVSVWDAGLGANYLGNVRVVNTWSGVDTIKIKDIDYGETPDPHAFSESDGTSNVMFYYKEKNAQDDTCTVEKPKDAGIYTVKAVVRATDLFGERSFTQDFEIRPMVSSVSVTKVMGLTYNGENQELIAESSAIGGTVIYSFDQQNWSGAALTAQNAGNYVVYYTIVPEKNYAALPVERVEVLISRGEVVHTGSRDQQVILGTVKDVSELFNIDLHAGVARYGYQKVTDDPQNQAVMDTEMLDNTDYVEMEDAAFTAAEVGIYRIILNTDETDNYASGSAVSYLTVVENEAGGDSSGGQDSETDDEGYGKEAQEGGEISGQDKGENDDNTSGSEVSSGEMSGDSKAADDAADSGTNRSEAVGGTGSGTNSSETTGGAGSSGKTSIETTGETTGSGTEQNAVVTGNYIDLSLSSGAESGSDSDKTTLANSTEKYQIRTVDDGAKTGTVVVSSLTTKTSKLVIPNEIEYNGYTLKVTEIADGACKGNKKLTSITIGKNVKKIGKKAFYGASKCKTLTIKSTKLTSGSVGKNAFGKLNRLVKVKVPKKKYEAYKKWLYKKGLSKKVKIKKI